MKPFEDQLQTIIDTIPVLAWSARADGSAEFFNKRWLDFTGLSAKNAQDWAWMVAIHPDDLNRLVDYWRAILDSGEPGEIEARLRRFDGVDRWFLFRATPSLDEHGNVVKWFGTNVDIEDRKRSETLLNAEKRALDLIASGVSVRCDRRPRFRRHFNRPLDGSRREAPLARCWPALSGGPETDDHSLGDRSSKRILRHGSISETTGNYLRHSDGFEMAEQLSGSRGDSWLACLLVRTAHFGEWDGSRH